MSDYSGEKWLEIYQKALVELEHAKMRGRIADARTQLSARLATLKNIPGLHDREYHAIDDACNALRYLEREQDRYDENQRREALEVAMQRLQYIAPKVRKLNDSPSE
jgi:hypothetical protein